jgi:hypothetical protein
MKVVARPIGTMLAVALTLGACGDADTIEKGGELERQTYVAPSAAPTLSPDPVITRMRGDAEKVPVSEDLRRIGELFVDFARSADPDHHHGPPADTPIELFIGGVLAKVIPSTRTADRREWQACPGGIGYAARSCPISPLTPLEEYPGPIAMTTEPPAHVCAHPTELPEQLDVYRYVTLAADAGLDCTSYFGVQLFVNDVGQVVAVNLVLSEP